MARFPLLACLLGLVAGCATMSSSDQAGDDAGIGRAGVPREPRVVRRAPVDVKALVDAAPTTAGIAPAAPGDPVLAAATTAGLVAVADPQLGRLSRAILLMVLDGQAPGGLLAAEMAERLGAGGGGTRSFAVGPGLPTTTAAEFAKAAAELGAGTRVRIGVASETREGQTVTLVAFTPTPLAIDSFERRRAPGETLSLTGHWNDPARALKFYADDGSGGVATGEVEVDDKGAVAFSHTLPETPGVVRIEFISADDDEVERDVYGVTVYVGEAPPLSSAVDDGAALDASSVIATVNGIRGERPLKETALLKEALAQPDHQAVRAHFARSGSLVRHPATQTFTGVFTANEFTTMTRQSPWVRFMFARATANAIGVVVEDQGNEGKTVRAFTADVRDAIHVPTEQKRALDGINRSRQRGKQKPLAHDEAVEAVLQTHVARMCSGEVDPADQGALQVALDKTLRKRRYASLAVFSATGDDVQGSSWARNFPDVKSADFNVAAVGACNGPRAVAGAKNGVLVVIVLGKR